MPGRGQTSRPIEQLTLAAGGEQIGSKPIRLCAIAKCLTKRLASDFPAHTVAPLISLAVHCLHFVDTDIISCLHRDHSTSLCHRRSARSGLFWFLVSQQVAFEFRLPDSQRPRRQHNDAWALPLRAPFVKR